MISWQLRRRKMSIDPHLINSDDLSEKNKTPPKSTVNLVDFNHKWSTPLGRVKLDNSPSNPRVRYDASGNVIEEPIFHNGNEYLGQVHYYKDRSPFYYSYQNENFYYPPLITNGEQSNLYDQGDSCILFICCTLIYIILWMVIIFYLISTAITNHINNNLLPATWVCGIILCLITIGCCYCFLSNRKLRENCAEGCFICCCGDLVGNEYEV